MATAATYTPAAETSCVCGKRMNTERVYDKRASRPPYVSMQRASGLSWVVRATRWVVHAQPGGSPHVPVNPSSSHGYL